MRINRILSLLAAAVIAVTALTACSEQDNTVEEYPNWQATNEAFFNHLSDSVKALLDENPQRTDWKRLKTWSKPDGQSGDNSQFVIVRVDKQAPDSETETPIYTDTVEVHYQGRLLPSVSYSTGFVFDQSYWGEFDEDTCVPAEFAIGNSSGNMLVDGFATALQHMRRGDRWTVYIPYQLGYGTSDRSSIPAYSTLIFDITMADFRHPTLTE